MKKGSLLIICLLFWVSSCTVNHGDFTVLSNKIVNIKDFDMGESKRLRNIEGKDTAHIITFIPTGIPTLSVALNNAFEKSDTDIMTDVNVKTREWYIPYIYGQSSWIVKGDAIKTRSN